MEMKPSFTDRMIQASLYSQFHDPKDVESKAPSGLDIIAARLFDPLLSTFSSDYREHKALLSNRFMMMEEAKKKFAHVGRAAEPLLTPRKEEKPAVAISEEKAAAPLAKKRACNKSRETQP